MVKAIITYRAIVAARKLDRIDLPLARAQAREAEAAAMTELEAREIEAEMHLTPGESIELDGPTFGAAGWTW